MTFSDLLSLGWNNLSRRKLRTTLTVLGVIIGTASIVVMISLGLGLERAMYKMAQEEGGLTNISVRLRDMYWEETGNTNNKEKEEKYLNDATVENFKNISHVVGVFPVLKASGRLVSGKYQNYVELMGYTKEGLEALNLPLIDGSLPGKASMPLEVLPGNMVVSNFYDENNMSNGFWESKDISELPDVDFQKSTIFFTFENTFSGEDSGDGTENPMENSMPVANKGKKYLVKGSGTLKGDPSTYTSYAMDVYCDMDALLKLMKKESKGGLLPGQPKSKSGKPLSFINYSNIIVRVEKVEEVTNVMTEIRAMGYEAHSNVEMIESQKKEMAIIQMVLGAIGMVSLLVAAIGITNTMMMSIYERTKEIGVMKVLGCGLKNIQQMFLLESAFIGFLGGILGNIISIVLSLLINSLAKGVTEGMFGVAANISVIPVWLVVTSTVFAMLMGMLAGYFPARKAMNLSPLNAISG